MNNDGLVYDCSHPVRYLQLIILFQLLEEVIRIHVYVFGFEFHMSGSVDQQKYIE
jgi:hypothetical protein